MKKLSFTLSAFLLLIALPFLVQHAVAEEGSSSRQEFQEICSSSSDCPEDEECISLRCVPRALPSLSPLQSITPTPSLDYPPLASPSGMQSPIISGNNESLKLTPSPSLSPVSTLVLAADDSSVCVDVTYLTALGHTAEEFVHSSHILANTLCPGNGLPCGTANHMIRMKGENLSYEQLCERVVCTKKTIVVNSVFTHVWEEKMHEDVALTMYDIRHPEMMQQMLHRVSQAVRKIIR